MICPSGSTFHAGENRCVAESGLAVTKVPKGATSAMPIATSVPTAPPTQTTDAKITVTCAFAHGWVAVVPVAAYPKDDEYIMQALIGFSDDPAFWQGQSEYAALEAYKAVTCDSNGATVGAPEGDVIVLVGEADTFAKRNRYSRNGMSKKLTLKKADAVRLDVAPKDLVRNFPCISCPWVHFEGKDGTKTEPFVMLARRASPEERGTDRKTMRVPVVDGTIRVVVSEHEDEVTHLDALSMEHDGVRLRAVVASGGRFALDADDGLEVWLAKGTRISQSYALPRGARVEGGMATITVSATGHYVHVPAHAGPTPAASAAHGGTERGPATESPRPESLVVP